MCYPRLKHLKMEAEAKTTGWINKKNAEADPLGIETRPKSQAQSCSRGTHAHFLKASSQKGFNNGL